MEKLNYPSVLDRVKAVVADSFIIIIFMLIVTYAFSLFENVHENLRILAFIFIFLLYDPLFTSMFGGTIGHMMFGLKVKREKDTTKNILFPLAIARFLFKGSLGWISLLTVSSNKKRKAIHDYLVRSVVIYKSKDES
ncbi:MAG: RDD family protein [Marinilabiliales bacterium]|nr:MAG: RDD family protein [Marinilabiliales bacterium]